MKSFTHLCWKRFISSRRLFSQSSLSTPNQNVSFLYFSFFFSFERYIYIIDIPSSKVIYLRDEKKGLEVFLIGTAHISKKSAMEVRDVFSIFFFDFLFDFFFFFFSYSNLSSSKPNLAYPIRETKCCSCRTLSRESQ